MSVVPVTSLAATADRRDQIDAYLATLRAEQTRFLAALEDARRHLDPNDGQLAHLAAIQGRLTRQFFDGQRAILKRRAELDAQLAEATADVEARAAALLERAHACSEAGQPLADDELAAFGVPVTPAVGSVRHEIAALGAEVVCTAGDARALEVVLDQALRPDDPDGAVAERQLRDVMDSWWKRTNDDGAAQLIDAQAWSSMRLHIAAVEARAIVGGVEPEPVADVDSSPLSTAYASTEHEHLDSLLASLVDSLDVTADAAPRRDLEIRDEVVADVTPAETYRSFWSAEDRAVEPAPRSLPGQVVLPMIAVTAVLAVVMAWVG